MTKIPVEEVLSGLMFDDVIEVKWIDACRVAPIKRHQLTNRVFATYKKRLGRFWAILYDKLYKQPFLIVCVDEDARVIECIPVKLIMSVEKLERGRGRRFKTTSDVGDVFLGAGMVKCFISSEGVGELDEEET